MLDFLGVSRSGYHAFLHRKPSASRQRKETAKKMIRQIYDKSNQNYGAPKITRELRKSGIRITERTVGTYMKEMGIKAQWVKPWTATTRNLDFSNQLHNILDEQFNPERPDAVWCTDITYIWTHDGFVYLTSIMDLYARKIIAWTLSNSMEVSPALLTPSTWQRHVGALIFPLSSTVTGEASMFHRHTVMPQLACSAATHIPDIRMIMPVLRHSTPSLNENG